jgi:hypothetical protein
MTQVGLCSDSALDLWPVQEELGSDLNGDTVHPDRVISGSSQSLQKNVGIVNLH